MSFGCILVLCKKKGIGMYPTACNAVAQNNRSILPASRPLPHATRCLDLYLSHVYSLKGRLCYVFAVCT